MVDIDDYKEVRECDYKGEHYSARDNGAVMRHSRPGKKLRKDDDKWTFGKPSEKTGYMEIGSQRVHRIVALAFHGEPEDAKMIVDHIDTNRRNNRPENLRWITRLDNVLLNPITRARIENVCGSVEAFLANPSLLRDHAGADPNFSWMRTVTPEEAHASLLRLRRWAEERPEPKGGKIGDWVFTEKKDYGNENDSRESKPSFVEINQREKKKFYESPQYAEDFMRLANQSDGMESLTPNAIQVDWRTPSEFPCCPQSFTGDPIEAYAKNLTEGMVFCKNGIYTSTVLDSAIIEDDKAIIVMTTSGEQHVKPWALAKVTYEDGKFYHENQGSYFEREGALKYFTLAQGKEWTGGEVFDDFA